MAFARTVTHTKTLISPSTGSADLVYGADYVSATSHTAAVSGADVGGIPYCPTATTEATSANLLFSSTGSPGSGPLFTVGSGATTSAGMYIGYTNASGYGGIWPTALDPASAEPVLKANSTLTFLYGVTAVNVQSAAFNIQPGGTLKFSQGNTAGAGPSITAGTATTDVAALSITRTNNNAAVATGVKWTFTDTTSAAGFLPFQILGGAAAATNLISVSKAGLVDAPAYSVGGAAGASFGPGNPTSLTIVNGIVTAAS